MQLGCSPGKRHIPSLEKLSYRGDTTVAKSGGAVAGGRGQRDFDADCGQTMSTLPQPYTHYDDNHVAAVAVTVTAMDQRDAY